MENPSVAVGADVVIRFRLAFAMLSPFRFVTPFALPSPYKRSVHSANAGGVGSVGAEGAGILGASMLAAAFGFWVVAPVRTFVPASRNASMHAQGFG